MATTVEHLSMSRMARRTHEKLAREIGHQPTLDMLLQEQDRDHGYAEHQLREAFAYAVRVIGHREAVRIVAAEMASV